MTKRKKSAVVHVCELTPFMAMRCCGLSQLELPDGDVVTLQPEDVTCPKYRPTDPNVDQIVAQVSNCFAVFGGGRGDGGFNLIVAAMKDRPPMFAMGVDVRAVVEFVLSNAAALRKVRRKATRWPTPPPSRRSGNWPTP